MFKAKPELQASVENCTRLQFLQNGPAVVRVNMFIRSISKIDDVKMEYSVQMTLREQWKDERMQFEDKEGQIRYLTLTDPDKIWKPDLFFSNEKEGHFHNIIMPNVLLRIYPNGDVLYSIRISLVLSCPMDLKYYPLDKQTCSITMVSYGYTTEDLVFLWKKDEPVQLVKTLHLPRFTLEAFLTDYCTSRTNTGEYSCLKVDLLFKREFSYYLIQIYIPCCMLVIVSWVSFWLDPNAIPARVSLGVTTLLTMATQISGINASLPPVSYTKAIDVWTGVCLTFVFGALLEFALVNYASRNEDHKKQARQRKWDLERAAALEAAAEDGPGSFGLGQSSTQVKAVYKSRYQYKTSSFTGQPEMDNEKTLVQPADLHAAAKFRDCEVHMGGMMEGSKRQPGLFLCGTWWFQRRFPTRSKRIDVISRIFFPLAFALFNLVYWTTYLLRDDKDEY
ncbi:glutamate-gated chloride channel-like [Uloborus diversus]|uniref:glutamate-gated chloride channel-like n=1 Tax=Uloborus diversus TaxID=327109 RepID=UPI00240945B0|nr:glutamate-gated chloride channel-like [Uloborus diversus]